MIALAGVACGAVLFLIFRRFTNRSAVRGWKRKRRAHVLGLYLFGDDPLNSLRSFGQIARANAMLLVHALPALAIAAPVIAASVFALDRYETGARLETGGPIVVTARWTGNCEPSLQGNWTTSPPVHVTALHEISWRIRGARPSGLPPGFRPASPRAGCNQTFVNTRLDSAAPPQPWLLWFSLIAWATSWLLGLFAQLLQTRPAFHRVRRNLA